MVLMFQMWVIEGQVPPLPAPRGKAGLATSLSLAVSTITTWLVS